MILVDFVEDFCENFFDRAGGINKVQVEFFGDFGIGRVDFLLEFVGSRFECFGGFAAVLLTVEANLVRNDQDETVVRVNITVGESFFGDFDDFAAGDAFAVALVGESGPVVAGRDYDAAGA